METNKQINNKNIYKFIILSALGIFLFLIPIPYDHSFTIPVGILIDWVKALIYDYTLIPLTLLIVLNAVGTLATRFFKPEFIMKNKWLKNLFDTTPLYIVSRVVGAIIILMYVFNVGPKAVIDPSPGGTMIDLARSLICILIIISYTMPLLTEFGIMEFVGILIGDIVRPLFKVPGRSAVDLITSWLGASNAAVLLTKQQYDRGFYTGREAATIMTNFSLVSIPFCYIVADILGVTSHFTSFYLIITITGIIMAIIIPRIPPINKMDTSYSVKVGKQIDETIPEGVGRGKHALYEASRRASKTNLEMCIKQGNDMFLSVIFGLSPIIIAWGTVALLAVEFTPIFDYLSYPMGMFMNLLGIEGAFEIAPSTLVGFADMFIPPLLLAPVKSIQTRFIVGAATLLQLIYMTETGAIMLQSDVPITMKDLIIIFLERTFLALVIVTVLTRFIVSF